MADSVASIRGFGGWRAAGLAIYGPGTRTGRETCIASLNRTQGFTYEELAERAMTIAAILNESAGSTNQLDVERIAFEAMTEAAQSQQKRAEAAASALAEAKAEIERLQDERCDHVQLYCAKCKTGPFWVSNHHPAECATCRAEAAEARVKALEEEIETDNKLLAERNEILRRYPCPKHGPCVPHVLNQLAHLDDVTRERDQARAEIEREGQSAGLVIHDMNTRIAKLEAALQRAVAYLDGSFAESGEHVAVAIRAALASPSEPNGGRKGE